MIIIQDKLSISFCNEIYKIPAGESDVHLSGKSVFDPVPFTAFRFNDVKDINVLQNRMKDNKKRFLISCITYSITFVFIASLLFLMEYSKFQHLHKPKEFSKEEITITLTNQFSEVSTDGAAIFFDSKDVTVLIVENPSIVDVKDFDKCTLNEYGNLIIAKRDFDSTIKLQNSDGLTFFEHHTTDNETNEVNLFCYFVYKTSDSFWLILINSLGENYNDDKQTIIDFAKSVKFSNP